MDRKEIILDEATKKDSEDLLSWRNHPSVRRYFFNNKPVSRGEHKRWFYSKMGDRSTSIYIARQGEDKVGVIRFETDRNSAAYVSVNLNPNFFGRGLGWRLIRLGTERVFNERRGVREAIAEIKISNITAQKAFSNAGYELAEKTRDKLIYKKKGPARGAKIMKNPYLRGKRIYLRPLLKSDINKKYLSWINNSQAAKFIDANRFPLTQKDLMDFYKQVEKNRRDVMFAIVIKNKNTHIGNIKLGSIDYIHRYGDIGILIGDKKFWGRGYGGEAITLLLDYAFNRLNLNKVILGLFANHKAAIKCYTKAGFKVEGRTRKLLYFDGKYVDKIWMGILKEEFNRSKNE